MKARKVVASYSRKKSQGAPVLSKSSAHESSGGVANFHSNKRTGPQPVNCAVWRMPFLASTMPEMGPPYPDHRE